MAVDKKCDICGESDIENIISHFYTTLLSDPAIGFYFTDIAKINLESHLPKIVLFWHRLLFGRGSQRSNLFAVHKALHEKAGLLKDHFDWWLHLFGESIDAHAIGPKAELMKERAAMIATSMFKALENGEPAPALEGVHFFDASGENDNAK